MSVLVNINGRIVNEREAVIPVFDHGFLYGDGVYEVLRTYGRQPFLFEAHQKRLRESASRIALAIPFSDDEMLQRITATIAGLPADDEAYVRLLLTRGVGDFTYDPDACASPTFVIIARPHVSPPSSVYDEGVGLAMVDVVRNHPDSVSPRIKSNNLLNNVLAMQEAIRRGAYEALMRNYRGELAECSQSNFFLVTGDEVLTPPLDAGLLAGVTRAFVFELGREIGIPVRASQLTQDDLAHAPEAFITSTTKEIVPVVRVDDRVIGDGRPGEVTRRLIDGFRAHTATLTRAAVRTRA